MYVSVPSRRCTVSYICNSAITTYSRESSTHGCTTDRAAIFAYDLTTTVSRLVNVLAVLLNTSHRLAGYSASYLQSCTYVGHLGPMFVLML
jgi:hypothetical protein